MKKEASFNEYYEEESNIVNEKIKREANEQNILKTIMRHPKLSKIFHQMRNLLDTSLKKIALQKDEEGNFLMDAYLPLDILRLYNGLEIHNLNKAFSKFANGFTLEAFIILSFRLLDIKREHSPYALLGMINLFQSLTIKRGKTTLSFQDFLNSFIKIQSIVTDNKMYISDNQKHSRFATLPVHDRIHHDNPIKNAYFSPEEKILLSLDEVAEDIRIYNQNAELKGRILPDKSKHLHKGAVFIDFAWAENLKMVGATYQDCRIGFFHFEDKFSKESVYLTKTLQVKIWYIQFCKKWITCDPFNRLYTWNDAKEELEELHLFSFKISDVVGIPPLRSLAIATFERKITIWDIEKNAVMFIMKLNESSAHTLKYSLRQNLLFVSTFEKHVKVFTIDIANDYTVIGRLDHPTAVTSIEIFDDENMVVTCDEDGNIKTWDSRTFKNIQQSKLNSLHAPSKIVEMKSTGRFCVMTNRLNFFTFSNKVSLEKSVKIIPKIGFSTETEEIMVSLSHDIRLFDMKYGVLSEIYDKDMFNISDKLVYVKRSKKHDRLFFADEHGYVKQLAYSNENAPSYNNFRPFSTDASSYKLDDEFDLLIVWNKNVLKIYRYEDKNQHSLVRSIEFPKGHFITQAKLFKPKLVLAIIINNSYVFFLNYQKFLSQGVFFNEIKETVKEKSISPHPRLKLRSLGSSIYKKSAKSSSWESPRNQRTSDEVTTDDKEYESPNKNEYRNNQDDQLVIPSSAKKEVNVEEILDIIFIPGYDCFAILDGKCELYLVGHNDFGEFRSKIHVKLEAKKDYPGYTYSKISIKLLDIEKLIEEKLVDPKHILRTYSSPREPGGKPYHYYLIIADSEHRIMMCNLKDAIESNFSSYEKSERLLQPYHSCEIQVTQNMFDDVVNKARTRNNQNDCTDEHYIPATNTHAWKAHSTHILDFKLVTFSSLLLLTLAQDCSLKVWSLKGELLCNLYINDFKKTVWNIQKHSDEKRIHVCSKIKEVTNSIYEKYQKEISEGLHKGLTEVIEEDLSKSDDNSPKKKDTNFGFEDNEYVTSQALYLLGRDRELFEKDSSNKLWYYPDLGIKKETSTMKTDKSVPENATPYTKSLAKKLDAIVLAKTKSLHNLDLRFKSTNSTQKNADREAVRQKFSKRVEAFHLRLNDKNSSLLTPQPKIIDYMEYYNNSKNDNSHRSSKTNLISLSNRSPTERLDRKSQRSTLIQDLDTRRKLIKNMKSTIPLTESVINKSKMITSKDYSPQIESSLNISKSTQNITTTKDLISREDLKNVVFGNRRFLTDYGDNEDFDLVNESSPINHDRSHRNITISHNYKDMYIPVLKPPEEKKRTKLPPIQYDVALDKELTKKMDSLQKLIKQMHSSKKEPELEEIVNDIEKIKSNRKSQMLMHLNNLS